MRAGSLHTETQYDPPTYPANSSSAPQPDSCNNTSDYTETTPRAKLARAHSAHPDPGYRSAPADCSYYLHLNNSPPDTNPRTTPTHSRPCRKAHTHSAQMHSLGFAAHTHPQRCSNKENAPARSCSADCLPLARHSPRNIFSPPVPPAPHIPTAPQSANSSSPTSHKRMHHPTTPAPQDNYPAPQCCFPAPQDAASSPPPSTTTTALDYRRAQAHPSDETPAKPPPAPPPAAPPTPPATASSGPPAPAPAPPSSHTPSPKQTSETRRS